MDIKEPDNDHDEEESESSVFDSMPFSSSSSRTSRMKKTCWWHKWETVKKGVGTAHYRGLLVAKGWANEEKSVVVELQRCVKCGAERGFIHELDGRVRKIDPFFIK